MSIIALFSGTFCNEGPFRDDLLKSTGFTLVSQASLIEEAAQRSGIAAGKIETTFSTKTSIFNKFTHEKERSLAYVKIALAEKLAEDNLIIPGYPCHLIPDAVTHVLRVCLIADLKFRIDLAMKEGLSTAKEAMKTVNRLDSEVAEWTKTHRGKEDPWDPSLYDMVLPLDKTSIEEGIALIQENLKVHALQKNPISLQAVQDFRLAASVEVALAREGHIVGVTAHQGDISITINKHVLMLNRLEEELKGIASAIAGVKSIKTQVGKEFHQSDIYRKYDFAMPQKVLLVDDEREFVQTLSERLQMRDMGSAIAYDGESALEIVSRDEPEVMILDLKMPGIDGIEVLTRVKESRPDIEVIILTGHGSDKDRDICMNLGAFAYLQKPVNIELLSKTLREANEKINARQRERAD